MDKYKGYWKDGKTLIVVDSFQPFTPRWRPTTRYTHNGKEYQEVFRWQTVDYLRNNCKKISKKEFDFWMNEI